jgi:hypothetical protein
MAGTLTEGITDFHDVVRLLEEHPEWRAELRRLILTDDLLGLPEQVAHLTEQVTALVAAQARTDARVAELAEAQARTDARVAELVAAQARTDARVAELAEAQARTDARVAELAEAQRRTETQVATLASRVDGLTSQMTALTAQMAELTRAVRGLTDDVGKLKGLGLEARVRTHSGAFFGSVLRRPHVLSSEELSELLEGAVDQGKLSPAEAEQIHWVDLVVQGTRQADGVAVHLVVEISWTVDADDVERAAHRAALLAKTGITAQPAVAGETVRSSAAQLALALQVWQVTDKEAVLPPP